MVKRITIAAALLAVAGMANAADADAGLSLGVSVGGIEIGLNADASISEQFAALDKNGDGVISRAEADASGKVASNFGAFDNSGDGALTMSEFKAGLQARAEGAVDAAKDKAAAAVQAGVATASNAAEQVRSKVSAGIQAGADAATEAVSKVSAGLSAGASAAADLSADLQQRFASLDSDGNGVITQAEAGADLDVSFAAADTNGDGVLTAAEFGASVEAGAQANTGFFGGLMNTLFGG